MPGIKLRRPGIRRQPGAEDRRGRLPRRRRRARRSAVFASESDAAHTARPQPRHTARRRSGKKPGFPQEHPEHSPPDRRRRRPRAGIRPGSCAPGRDRSGTARPRRRKRRGILPLGAEKMQSGRMRAAYARDRNVCCSTAPPPDRFSQFSMAHMSKLGEGRAVLRRRQKSAIIRITTTGGAPWDGKSNTN